MPEVVTHNVRRSDRDGPDGGGASDRHPKPIEKGLYEANAELVGKDTNGDVNARRKATTVDTHPTPQHHRSIVLPTADRPTPHPTCPPWPSLSQTASLPTYASAATSHPPTSLLVFRASGGVDEEKQRLCLVCLCEDRNATIVHGGTGHIACCLTCARILKFRKMTCPVCRLKIDSVIQHFWGDGKDSCDMYYQ